MITTLHFLRPLWFLALLPLAWLIWRYWHSRQQGGVWQSVCDAHLLPHLLVTTPTRNSRLPVILLGLVGVFIIIALAGPVWSKLPQPIYHNSAATVVILSLSKSMDAPDVPPSRLERAKLKLLDFLKRQREGQTALIVYAGEAYVVSPLTDDAATIASQVNSLETNMMPVVGNNLSEALNKANALLDQDGVFKGGRVLLIGDNAANSEAMQSVAALQAKGRVFSVLAVGTSQGAPIPTASGGFVKNSQGAILIQGLDRAALARLAAIGHGHLVNLTANDDDLNQLWLTAQGTLFKSKQQGETHTADVWREEGPWLLLMVLPLVALLWRQGWLAVIVLAVLVQQPHPVQAATWEDMWARPNQQAYHALQHGDAKSAAKLFQDPTWRSVAEYRAGNFADAAIGFGMAQTTDALYNQGNALARAGKLEQAAQNYRKVLQQQPHNEDALHNLKIVENLLKRQQQKQQSGQNQQSKGQQQNQDQHGQGQQNQNQQGQSGQSQQAQQDNKSNDKTGHEQQHQNQQGQAGQSEQAQRDNKQNEKSGQSQQGQQHKEQQVQAGKPQQAKQDLNPNSEAKPSQKALGQQAQTQQAQQHKSQDEHATNSAAAEQADAQQEKQEVSESNANASVTPHKKQSESAQALEQWLRRIPDDPGGLLRNKFRMLHDQRQQAAQSDGN